MLISMANDSLDAIEKQEFSRLKEIREMEATNKKLTDFCRRILTKTGYKDNKKTTIMYSLVHDIEKIADDYKHICDYFYENKKTVGSDVLKIYKAVNDYLGIFYELFYKFDMKKNERMFDEGKAIIKEAYELFRKKSAEEQILLHHLINLTTKIYELTLPFLQLNI